MAGDAFKKVMPGQKLKIPAAAYNAFIDAARAHRGQQQSREADASKSFRTSGIVRVQNTSGEPRDRFDILGIDGPIFSPEDNLDSFANEVLLRGVTPSRAMHAGRFVVLLEPLAEDAIGRAVISGVCPVRVQLTGGLPTDEGGDRFAEVIDDDATRLGSGGAGSAALLWMQPPADEEDTAWAVVRLGNEQPILRKAEMIGTLTQGDEEPALARLLEYKADEATWLRTEQIIEVYAGPGFRGVAFGRTDEVDAGEQIDVYASVESGRWHAIVGGWYFHGAVVDSIQADSHGEVLLDLGSGESARQITVEAHNAYGPVYQGQRVSVAWNTAHRHWDIGDVPWPLPRCGVTIAERQLEQEGPARAYIEVYPPHLAGPGLGVEEGEGDECDQLKVDIGDGCGLTINQDGELAVDPEGLAGPGLEPSGDCSLAVDPGCGVQIDGNDRVAVDNLTLAGSGLAPESVCSIAVDAGCGLAITPAGQVAVDPEDIAGTGLEALEGCQIAVKFGCGLNLGLANEIIVDAAQVAGPGLEAVPEGECELQVRTGCGLAIDGDDNDALTVDRNALAGKGLQAGGDDCDLEVMPGCGITVDENGVHVDPEDLAGKGLAVEVGGCAIAVDDTPDVEQDQAVTVLTDATLAIDGCDVKLQRKTRTLTFRHNADGLLIGVVVGDEQPLEDSTVDVTECCCEEPEPEPEFVELTRCDNSEVTLVVDAADLTGPELGSVHREGVWCWEVTAVDVAGPGAEFSEDESFPAGGDPCGDCDTPSQTLYEMQNCDTQTTIIVDGVDLTNPQLGSVHRDDENFCWEVIGADVSGSTVGFVETARFASCGECDPQPPECESCGAQDELAEDDAAVHVDFTNFKFGNDSTNTLGSYGGSAWETPPNEIIQGCFDSEEIFQEYQIVFRMECDSEGGVWVIRFYVDNDLKDTKTATQNGNTFSASFNTTALSVMPACQPTSGDAIIDVDFTHAIC